MTTPTSNVGRAACLLEIYRLICGWYGHRRSTEEGSSSSMSRAGEEPSPEDIDQGRRTFFATVGTAFGTSWLGGASAHQRVNEQARAGVAHSAAPWRATFGTLKHVDAGM